MKNNITTRRFLLDAGWVPERGHKTWTKKIASVVFVIYLTATEPEIIAADYVFYGWEITQGAFFAQILDCVLELI
jgi:hypothetical protein